MLNLSRRLLLKLIIATGLFPLLRPVQSLGQDKSGQVKLDRLTLDAFIDRLIPADETPGAVELGVTKQLLDKAKMNRRYSNLLIKGCDWLDQQARSQGYTSFSLLPLNHQEAIIQQAADSPRRTLPGVFFKRLWKDTCFYYYSHPEVLKRLTYAGPPQPAGFLDYSSPPVTPKKPNASTSP